MKTKRIGLILIGLALIFGTSADLMAKSDSLGDGGYTAKDKEFYLDADQVALVRPGVDLTIMGIEIPDDLQPVVTFSIVDPFGMPLDREGVYTQGAVDIRFMLTYIPVGEEQKINYHDRTRDRDGTYVKLEDGVYAYKFTTVLPDDYEVDATHTLAGVATRDLRSMDLSRYYDNELLNFVPSGDFDPVPRDVVDTSSCNRCHDPLGEHGGRYQEVAVCGQCHTPDLVDDGVSYSLDQMVHRVHQEMGAEYPPAINDCEVCHTGGTPTDDFPLVSTPAKVPACDQNGKGLTTLVWGDQGKVEVRFDSPDGALFARTNGANSKETGNWVRDGLLAFLVEQGGGDTLQELELNTTVFGCAGNAPGVMMGMAATTHTNWMTRPSRAVCGSCHEVDFESGEHHPPQANDNNCSLCHQADSGDEYDRSIRGAHTVEYKSDQLPGVFVEVTKIVNTGPGMRPTVHFSVSDKNGRFDPSIMNRLRFVISGPNEDFDVYIQEDALAGLVASGSSWTYTFLDSIPMDAVGSYTFGVEGRVSGVVINEGEDDEFTMNDQMQNFTVPIAVTDMEAMPRRQVVDDAKCESCHSNLSLHGENRHNATSYCQTCHRPGATDAVVRPEGTLPAESIHFKYMIHKIHRGAELERGYFVYGYRSSEHDYGHVEFPGDLRNCEACHVDDTYTLPIPEGALDTVTNYDFFTPTQPIASACLSCHDGKSAAAHADANTSATVGESCETCHGPGKDADVEKVHAR